MKIEQCHDFEKKISQIGMISFNMTLFKIICVLYQFHHWTLPIMKIDRGQIKFPEYVSTETEPVITPTDRPKSVSNRCVSNFLVVFCVVLLLFVTFLLD